MRKPGLYMFFAKTDDPMQTHTVYVEVFPESLRPLSSSTIDAWIEHYAWIYDSYTFLNWWIVNKKGD